MRKQQGRHSKARAHLLPAPVQAAVARILPVALLGGTAAGVALAAPAGAAPQAHLDPGHAAKPQTSDGKLRPAALRVLHKATRKSVTVREGDTLSGLAKTFCGHAGEWPGLYDANQATIGHNPNLILPGEHLRLACSHAALAAVAAATQAPAHETADVTSAHHKKTHHRRHHHHHRGVAVKGMLSCKNLGDGGIGEMNVARMWDYFVTHGLTRTGAAAVIGSIDGESGGNPESVGDGGGGLIGWTPLRPGLVTGDRGRDLAVQEAAVISYIEDFGSIRNVNDQPGVAAALTNFVFNYERPAAPGPDSAQRIPAAEAAFADCAG